MLINEKNNWPVPLPYRSNIGTPFATPQLTSGKKISAAKYKYRPYIDLVNIDIIRIKAAMAAMM